MHPSHAWKYQTSDWKLDSGKIRDIGRDRKDLNRWDLIGMETALRKRIEGEIRFDDGSRALYAADASNYRQTPIGVVIPKHAEDVIETLAVCREFDAPVLARGGGTSLGGQCCNVAVVLDFTKYLNRVVDIDPKRRLARVQPGTILDDLRKTAEKHRLTFGPDPATHDH
jgi:FAD/FMN-containing dehydrogenase